MLNEVVNEYWPIKVVGIVSNHPDNFVTALQVVPDSLDPIEEPMQALAWCFSIGHKNAILVESSLLSVIN